MTILTVIILSILCVIFMLTSFISVYHVKNHNKLGIILNSVYSGLALSGIILLILRVTQI